MRRLLPLLGVLAGLVPAGAQQVEPKLVAHPWRVVEVLGRAMAFPVSLEFGADGRLSGRGPCNRYTAGFKQSGGSLEIGQAAATRMFCEGRMEAEKLYFDALRLVHRYTLGDGTLSLNSADDSALIKLAK